MADTTKNRPVPQGAVLGVVLLLTSGWFGMYSLGEVISRPRATPARTATDGKSAHRVVAQPAAAAAPGEACPEAITDPPGEP